MSDTTDQNETSNEEKTDEVQISILGQYIKDLSFENPTPAQTIQKLATDKPSMNINVGLNAQQVGEDLYEVNLKITATALSGEETAFVAELLYSGLFGIKNLPEGQLQPFLMVEAPRQIFPFARRILSDVTRDGGFPPLMLEPIDFGNLYQQQLAAASEQQGNDKEEDIVVN